MFEMSYQHETSINKAREDDYDQQITTEFVPPNSRHGQSKSFLVIYFG